MTHTSKPNGGLKRHKGREWGTLGLNGVLSSNYITFNNNYTLSTVYYPTKPLLISQPRNFSLVLTKTSTSTNTIADCTTSTSTSTSSRSSNRTKGIITHHPKPLSPYYSTTKIMATHLWTLPRLIFYYYQIIYLFKCLIEWRFNLFAESWVLYCGEEFLLHVLLFIFFFLCEWTYNREDVWLSRSLRYRGMEWTNVCVALRFLENGSKECSVWPHHAFRDVDGECYSTKWHGEYDSMVRAGRALNSRGQKMKYTSRRACE